MGEAFGNRFIQYAFSQNKKAAILEEVSSMAAFLFDRKLHRNYLSNINLSVGSHCGG